MVSPSNLPSRIPRIFAFKDQNLDIRFLFPDGYDVSGITAKAFYKDKYHNGLISIATSGQLVTATITKEDFLTVNIPVFDIYIYRNGIALLGTTVQIENKSGTPNTQTFNVTIADGFVVNVDVNDLNAAIEAAERAETAALESIEAKEEAQAIVPALQIDINSRLVKGLISDLRLITDSEITSFQITDKDKTGIFIYDSTDTTTVDDGSTCIISGLRRFKRDGITIIDPKWFGGSWNGIGNDSIAIQKAVDFSKDGDIIQLPKLVKINSSVTISNKSITIDGNGCKIIKGSGLMWNISGDWSLKADITNIGSASALRTTITCANASLYKQGDVVKIISIDRYTNRRSNSPRRGEFAVVDSVLGNVITLTAKLINTYTTNPRIAKLNKTTPIIKNMNWTCAEEGLFCSVRNLYAPVFENITILEGHSIIFQLRSSYQYRIIDFSTQYVEDDPDASTPILGYGINDLSGFGGTIENMRIGNMRHAYTTNADNEPDLTYEEFTNNGEPMHNSIRNSKAVGCNETPFDTHENGYNIVFDNCHSVASKGSGFHIRNKNTILNNCVSENDNAGLTLHNFSGTDAMKDSVINNFVANVRGYAVYGTDDTGTGFGGNITINGGVFKSEVIRPLYITNKGITFNNCKIISAASDIVYAVASDIVFNDCDFIHTFDTTCVLVGVSKGSKVRVNGGKYINVNIVGNRYLIQAVSDATSNDNKVIIDDLTYKGDVVLNSVLGSSFLSSYAIKAKSDDTVINSSSITITSATSISFPLDKILDNNIYATFSGIGTLSNFPIPANGMGTILVLRNTNSKNTFAELPVSIKFLYSVIRGDSTVVFIYSGTEWVEVSRSSNSAYPVTSLTPTGGIIAVPRFNATYYIGVVSGSNTVQLPANPTNGDTLDINNVNTSSNPLILSSTIQGIDSLQTTKIPHESRVSLQYNGSLWRIVNIEYLRRNVTEISTSVSDLSKSTLNSTYPYDLLYPIGTIILAPLAGFKYQRTDSTNWVKTAITIVV